MLGHLLALGVLHVAHDHAVLEGAAVEQQGADGHQRVEPAAGLVDGLGDEVGREVGLEHLLVLKGIVPLGEGHGAGIVPAVDHLGGALHLAAAAGAGQRHRVDVGAVQLDVVGHIVSHLLQFRPGADDVDLAAVLADPHRQRGAPVALAAQAPVDHVLQEVAEAALLDVVRVPVDGAVVGHQPVAHGGHADEPGAAGVVDQRGVAAPAEGIIVGKVGRVDQLAFLLQPLQDHRVGLLHEHAGPVGVLRHLALGVHQLQEGDVVLPAHPGVVLAEGGGLVHHAGAVGHGDVVVADHRPGVFGVLRALDGGLLEVEQRLVAQALQVAAGEGGLVGDLHALAQHLFDQGVAHDDGAAVIVEFRVGLVGVHAQRHVAGQRPGGGGPGVDVGVLLILHLEAHHGGALLDLLVALGDLVAGQGGAAAGAVGHDLVALVQQALVGHLLQAPPHRFDVVVVIGDVGVFHVGPEAHALGHALPFALVLPDALLALLDEGLDAVLLDLLLAVQAQQLLDLQLHRQAVGVPARLAGDQLALHRVVAGQQVLDGAGLDVADVGLAVGGRRAVVEGPDLLALPVLHGLLEDVVVVPELDDFLFTRQEIQRRGDLFDHPCVPPRKKICASHPHGTKALRGTTQVGISKGYAHSLAL